MLIFLTIITLQVSCLILPGPDFFVTISNSIKFGQKYGLITALGVSIGIFINTFIVYWCGSFLLYQHPMLFNIVILIGISYLIYIAFNLYKNVFTKQDSSSNKDISVKTLQDFTAYSKRKFFINGVFTNLANAKVLVFFSSMLSLVDGLSSLWVFTTWITIALTTYIWFSTVAVFFGNSKLRQLFFRNIKKIELISAIFITGFVIIILVERFF
ncbi:MAG: threonine efflux protein [Francisella sp.]|jgi:threonine efflux protein